MKKILFVLLSIQSILLQAQKEKVVHIDPEDTVTWTLSQIAEKVTPISLSNYTDKVQYIYMTDEYLYLCSLKSIIQVDISGKFIRKINTKGFICGITGDIVKKEIYISVGSDKIISYDYSLIEKKTYQITYSPNSIFFHDDNLWICSYTVNDSTNVAYYKISKLELTTGKETFLPFEIKDGSGKYPGIKVISTATFSVYGDYLMFSNGVDSVIYGIKDGKISPMVRYKIDLIEDMLPANHPIFTQGFIGKYLLIEYFMVGVSNPRSVKSFLFLKNMETGKEYNQGFYIYDDVYHTGYCHMRINLNKKDHFYIYREKNDLSKAANKLILPDGPAIFIVKIKQ